MTLITVYMAITLYYTHLIFLTNLYISGGQGPSALCIHTAPSNAHGETPQAFVK